MSGSQVEITYDQLELGLSKKARKLTNKRKAGRGQTKVRRNKNKATHLVENKRIYSLVGFQVE